MLRLCPTLASTCGIAFCIWGCSGQKVEGRWAGQLPYADADDCRIKLLGDAKFELGCRKDSWLGQGIYEFTGDQLTLTYSVLARNGKPIKNPQALNFRVRGEGNTLRLTDGTQILTWTRSMNH